MSKDREFVLSGRALAGGRYHYKQCGLDNVYLLNGFTWETVDGERAVTVSNIDGLRKAIGRSLVLEQKTLSPKELRFLRREMGLTQEELGQKLRLSGQQVARWEKGECEIGGAAEALLRIRYVVSMLPEHDTAAMDRLATILQELVLKLDLLNTADEVASAPHVFRETPSGWEMARAA